ncbi:HET-domain-containing protein, partial [Cadophora sp. DSE1049]
MRWPYNIRLVDVHTRCVVDADSSWPYACLSYVWGSAKYKQNGSLRDSGVHSVKTFKDAFNLTRQLGIRYLWVDSLCILQDDMNDLSTHIPRMGQIYQDSQLTIVSDSPDASTGIPGISLPRAKSSPTFESGGFSLVGTRPTLSETLTTSFWFKRAWTLQEMCFSRRILLLTDSQVFCRCKNTFWSE